MNSKRCFLMIVLYLLGMHAFTAPPTRDTISVQALDNMIGTINKKIDSVKSENYGMKKKIEGCLFSADAIGEINKSRSFYNIGCLCIIIFLSLSIMFITAFLLFKKVILHKYNYIDFWKNELICGRISTGNIKPINEIYL